jgi:hypothetical protein
MILSESRFPPFGIMRQIQNRPREEARAVSNECGLDRLALVGAVPGNPDDVGAADADVGKLAVAKARQFVQALVVAVPLVDEANNSGNHGVSLSLTDPAGEPANPVDCKIGILPGLKRNFVALQLGEKRIAQRTDF